MNDVKLIGNLARPVELRELTGGKVVGRTMLAVSRMKRGGERAGTDWIPLVLWDAQARNAARYLEKGSKVAVDGRLHGDYWPPRSAATEGKPSRLRLEVVVDRITYLSTRRAGAGQAPAESESDSGPSEPKGSK